MRNRRPRAVAVAADPRTALLPLAWALAAALGAALLLGVR
jgi:hypothetical protein